MAEAGWRREELHMRETDERFGDGPLAARIREAASEWDKVVCLNLTLPHQVLRRATQWLIERQWPQITRHRVSTRRTL